MFVGSSSEICEEICDAGKIPKIGMNKLQHIWNIEQLKTAQNQCSLFEINFCGHISPHFCPFSASFSVQKCGFACHTRCHF